MKMRSSVFLLGVTCLPVLLTAGMSSSSTSIKIQFPSALLDADKSPHEIVNHRSALFGGSDFNRGALQAKIFLDEQPILKDDVTPTCPRGDIPADDKLGAQVLLMEGYQGCPSYEFKAEQAQIRKFKGLLVINEQCLTENLDKHSDEAGRAGWKEYCKDHGGVTDKLEYMGGVDKRVTIPPMIIPRWEGMRLLECYKQATGKDLPNRLTDASCRLGDIPRVELRWRIPQKDKLDWTLWSTALLNADLFVSNNWVDHVMPRLVEYAEFTPKYFVWDGRDFGCEDKANPKHCMDACHNNGLYCHMDPDHLGEGPIKGRLVSQENLRQHCAYKTHGTDSEGKLKWWKYIHLVSVKCTGEFDEKTYYTAACSEAQHKAAGLDFTKTMGCITANGNGYDEDSSKNDDWKAELEERKNYKVELQRLPTLIANGAIVELELNLHTVLGAFCASFSDTKKVDWCDCFHEHQGSSDKDLANRCFGAPAPPTVSPPTPEPAQGVSYSFFFFIVAMLVGSFVAAGITMRKKFQGQMHEDVRNIMSEYVSMDSEEGAELTRRARRDPVDYAPVQIALE